MSMITSSAPPVPPALSDSLFKGIALFTPGGDLVYCIDPHKQNRWHFQLCAVLQEMLGLTEPPHFLVPCYTATIDRWFDPRIQQVHTYAEASPFVFRHQALLNAIFAIEPGQWRVVYPPGGRCDPAVVRTYQQRFPQLWEEHDLVIRYEKIQSYLPAVEEQDVPPFTRSANRPLRKTQGYVLRLFVSGSNAATGRILENLHQLLEQSLQQPYTLKVIDIHKHPELAELDQISATPTLVRAYPQPVKRVVGGLDDVARLSQVLLSMEVPDSRRSEE